MKWTKLLLICTCLTIYGYSSNFYETCHSTAELIYLETQAIASTPSTNLDELAKLYVSRGESYMLCFQNEKALDDFEKALFYVEYSTDEILKWGVVFRALLGKVVCYDNLDIQEKAEYSICQLKSVVDYFNCEYENFELAIYRKGYDDAAIFPVYVDPNQPQPSWWCEETVKNTADALFKIVSKIRNKNTRAAATKLIERLENKALSCCFAGGLWSRCVEPLRSKLEMWNWKWKSFGIPPDPSWDSDIK